MSEYRDEFVQALREGKRMRNGMFSVLEKQHATDFANGPKGVKLYNDLFDAVSAAEVPDALEEYEKRFFPLLDPDGSRARAAALASAAASASAAKPWIRRDGPWLMGAFAAVAVAVTVLALNATAGPPKTAPELAAVPAAVEAAPVVAAEPEIESATVVAAAPAVEPTTTAIATEPTPAAEASEVATEAKEPAAEPAKAPVDE